MTSAEPHPPDPQPIGAVFSDPARPVRVTVALGDTERERQLLPALADCGELAIAARCLSADELLVSLSACATDVALISTRLHRLDASSLVRLSEARMPLLFLETAPGQPDLERRSSSHAASWRWDSWACWRTWRLWMTAARRRSKRFLRWPR